MGFGYGPASAEPSPGLLTYLLTYFTAAIGYSVFCVFRGLASLPSSVLRLLHRDRPELWTYGAAVARRVVTGGRDLTV